MRRRSLRGEKNHVLRGETFLFTLLAPIDHGAGRLRRLIGLEGARVDHHLGVGRRLAGWTRHVLAAAGGFIPLFCIQNLPVMLLLRRDLRRN